MSNGSPAFRLDRISAADTLVNNDPFSFIIASNVLDSAQQTPLADEFSKYSEAGYFPLREQDRDTPVGKLVEEVTSPRIADALGEKIGVDKLSQYPTLTTLSRSINRRHGNIHTDSKSKIATALIYVNGDWNEGSKGCLRMLRSAEDIEDVVAPEIKPVFGNFVIFKRADNSYHGHLPYEGERRVIQIAWVRSQADIDRKTKRGRLSNLLKRLLGGLDKKLGARGS